MIWFWQEREKHKLMRNYFRFSLPSGGRKSLNSRITSQKHVASDSVVSQSWFWEAKAENLGFGSENFSCETFVGFRRLRFLISRYPWWRQIIWVYSLRALRANCRSMPKITFLFFFESIALRELWESCFSGVVGRRNSLLINSRTSLESIVRTWAFVINLLIFLNEFTSSFRRFSISVADVGGFSEALRH